ncbi:hypothetical protein BpHYR1_021359 [Brachionus plicatilis]|uniref:Uncharacterized protein n=1 Tax=Brachionus plicatilis TaxID=10195 RepID=A0A3M7Q7F4_BRAPC|nr:hypothetical protein BpHYR1_021359 [Brachionus plicatilis]
MIKFIDQNPNLTVDRYIVVTYQRTCTYKTIFTFTLTDLDSISSVANFNIDLLITKLIISLQNTTFFSSLASNLNLNN